MGKTIKPPANKFKAGDLVRVCAEDRTGHVRTPRYIRGKIGRIDQVLGEFLNPELLAYGADGLPKRILYKVVFNQGEVWDRYEVSTEDKVYVDIFDHWLEQA